MLAQRRSIKSPLLCGREAAVTVHTDANAEAIDWDV